jgi:hypothetical protein
MAEENIQEPVLNEIKVDEVKVKELQELVDKKTADLSNKVYAVSMDANSLAVYSKVINSITWKGKEALGILEINKQLDEITKKGISNDVIFLGALTIEASHYFLNRYESTGTENAQGFIDLFKKIEQALSNISQDNKNLDDLKKDLAAAQQGITAE